jgi:hypothetical protein
MDKIFVDTGAWMACMNEDDKNHEKAAEYLKVLLKSSTQIITSNYVKSETITLLKYLAGHKIALRAMDIWREAEKIGSLKTYLITEEDIREADKIFANYEEYMLTFTDCTSFAVCRKLEIDKVFGFDSKFNNLGFLIAPYQIKNKEGEYTILRPL